MIEVKDLCKTFRVARRDAGMAQAVRALFHREYTEIHALQNLSFTVQDGEMIGYIGPNGAGKSSTVKVLSGILTPDSGSCVIDGLVPWKDRKAHVRRIGVVFGQRSQLWWDVPVLDSFELLRDIYAVEPVVWKRNLEELTLALDLKDILRTPARQLSLGQRMRCEIAASLLHDPQILFLDEPTIGLDAVSKLAVRQFIRQRHAEHGTTVILTTHDMQDIEALTERILLIGQGQILLDGSLDELRRRSASGKILSVEYAPESVMATSEDENARFLLSGLPEGLCRLPDQDGRIRFAVDSAKISLAKGMEAVSSFGEVRDLSITDTPTEEVVLKLYREFAL